MQKKIIYAIPMVFLLAIAICGCSDSEANVASDQNPRDSGVNENPVPTSSPSPSDSEAGNASYGKAEPTQDDSDSGSVGEQGSGGKKYVAYENKYEGTGMITSMYPNYCMVPVMPGDTVEIWATSDVPARFLSGGQGLLNHYIMYNGMSYGAPGDYQDIYESESEHGGTKYHKVINIDDPMRYMFVFAVQSDADGSNNVRGTIKITVNSSASQGQHSDAFNAGMDAGIAAVERQGRDVSAFDD
ncbi:MAG: hypothetical protein PHX61_07735 [Alphaproteobacteria bacterium]|nr:hypothetical protein [Alphaproteobacteria bacterium]